MRPRGKVRATSRGNWQPLLAWEGRLLPLGEQASQEAAEATYDVAKTLVSGERLEYQSEARVWAAPPLPPPARRRCRAGWRRLLPSFCCV